MTRGAVSSEAAPRHPAGRKRITALRRWWDAPEGEGPEELASFAASGHLGARSRWPDRLRRVVVLGEAAISIGLATALRGAGACPLVVDGVHDVDRLRSLSPAAVCAVHPGPAPGWWAELDELTTDGIAWQRVSVEGRHAIVEPVAATPHDVGHGDVRARRLAAAGSGHEHLAAYWADVDVRSELDAADLALLAALTARDLATWAAGDPIAPEGGSLVPSPLPARRRLRVLHLDTGAIADHPVLPVPRCAP